MVWFKKKSADVQKASTMSRDARHIKTVIKEAKENKKDLYLDDFDDYERCLILRLEAEQQAALFRDSKGAIIVEDHHPNWLVSSLTFGQYG